MRSYDELFHELAEGLTIAIGNVESLKSQHPEITRLETIGKAADRASNALAIVRDHYGLTRRILRKLGVLVVDDEPEVAKVAADAIKQYGNRADIARSGEDGINKFFGRLEASRNQPSVVRPYDLVLTDLIMLGVDGYDVVSAVRNASPHTRVVVMTGTPSDWERISSEKGPLSPDALLPKPTHLNDIYLQLAKARQPRYIQS